MIKYIDKPIEEMTMEELETARDVHSTFTRHMDRYIGRVEYMYKLNVHEKTEELPEDIGEQYINGVITDKEYKEAKETESQEAINRWVKRVEFYHLLCFEHKAYLEEVRARIKELKRAAKLEEREKEKAKKKKPKKLPEKYGYDPRAPVSKTNYRRDDWGKTRENKGLHTRRKKEY